MGRLVTKFFYQNLSFTKTGIISLQIFLAIFTNHKKLV
nr:MAG TPA: hypothetical protein [Caudoviricetes sp.]